jgi:hypothetical protein
MRILFCGDRYWSAYKVIADVMAEFNPDVVIEGEARGADSMAADAADYFGMPVLRFPANWDKYGRAAGPIRNSQMLKEGKPDMVVAFHDDITTSKGTKNIVDQAKKHGIPVKVYNSKGVCYYESVIL